MTTATAMANQAYRPRGGHSSSPGRGVDRDRLCGKNKESKK